MLSPLRRSLGDRVAGAAFRCTVCTRQIHAHNALRSTAAPAQASQDYDILPPSNPKYSPSRQEQQSKNFSKHKSKQLNIAHSPSPSHSAYQQAQPAGDPLLTASKLDSPYRWDKPNILALYAPPSEDEIPSQIQRGKATDPRKKTVYNWKKSAFQYLEKGLQLGLKIETLPFKSRNNAVRVKLVAHWGLVSEFAIGDGTSKVGSCRQPCSDLRPPPQRMPHYISSSRPNNRQCLSTP